MTGLRITCNGANAEISWIENGHFVRKRFNDIQEAIEAYDRLRKRNWNNGN